MLKEKYHILALGGIGMSAVARLLSQQGHDVSGYDDSLSDLTARLQDEGVALISNLPDKTKYLVYSSAIPDDSPVILKAKKQKIEVLHRSDVLSKLMHGKETILVSGTHGKTTVSSLLSHALEYAKLDPCFAVGGILNNYNTNAKWGSGDFFVSEADESDGSFLKHPSKYAIVTNIDNDHLDYWKTSENLYKAFKKFSTKADKLIWCFDDTLLRRMSLNGISYGFSEKANVRISDYKTVKDGSVFSVRYLNNCYEDIFIPLFGKHQVLNATAVLTFFLTRQLSVECLFKSFVGFKGIKRRQELIGAHNNVELYTDYAHHPTEIKAILESFRNKIEERKLLVVFQPHRYSRVSALMDEFKGCFEIADSLYITEIYSAGEKAQTVCEEDFFYSIEHDRKHKLCAENFQEKLLNDIKMHDCVLFLGAGDINQKALHFFGKFKNTYHKLKVGILYGGVASEHEISLKSAQFFFDNIDHKSYDIQPCFIEKNFEIDQKLISKILSCDVCIPVLHGKKGEDGLIQAVFEALQIPYVGCDYYASSVCMNKAWTKAICENANVPTAKFLHIAYRDWKLDKNKVIDDIKKIFKAPFYIKGCHMGSTIGMLKCESFSSLEKDINKVFSFDNELIVEVEIIGKQVEFALWGNDFIHIGNCAAEIALEGMYTYEKKYDKKYENCLAKIPAEINSKLLDQGKRLAIKAYKACSCRGLARIDFFLDQNNQFILNEINPFPGFTKTSHFYQMLKQQGISASELINQLIILAFHAKRSYV